MEYLTQGDGFTDVALCRPHTVLGVTVTKLRMREPLVRDRLATDGMKGSDGDREIAFISMLCDITPDDLKGMSLKDYARLQAALLFFIN